MLIDLVIGAFIGMLMLGAYLKVAVAVDAGRRTHREGARLAAGAAALREYLQQRGVSLITSGTAAGFINPFEPSEANLKDAGFMPRYVGTRMPYGGTMTFSVRRSARNDLLGLACDDTPITRAGQPAPDLAAKIMAASEGTGLMTSIANPGVLNGPGMANVASPVAAAAIVCAWAFLPNPT